MVIGVVVCGVVGIERGGGACRFFLKRALLARRSWAMRVARGISRCDGCCWGRGWGWGVSCLTGCGFVLGFGLVSAGGCRVGGGVWWCRCGGWDRVCGCRCGFGCDCGCRFLGRDLVNRFRRLCLSCASFAFRVASASGAVWPLGGAAVGVGVGGAGAVGSCVLAGVGGGIFRLLRDSGRCRCGCR